MEFSRWLLSKQQPRRYGDTAWRIRGKTDLFLLIYYYVHVIRTTATAVTAWRAGAMCQCARKAYFTIVYCSRHTDSINFVPFIIRTGHGRVFVSSKSAVLCYLLPSLTPTQTPPLTRSMDTYKKNNMTWRKLWCVEKVEKIIECTRFHLIFYFFFYFIDWWYKWYKMPTD